jgi:hypothetical protein
MDTVDTHSDILRRDKGREDLSVCLGFSASLLSANSRLWGQQSLGPGHLAPDVDVKV